MEHTSLLLSLKCQVQQAWWPSYRPCPGEVLDKHALNPREDIKGRDRECTWASVGLWGGVLVPGLLPGPPWCLPTGSVLQGCLLPPSSAKTPSRPLFSLPHTLRPLSNIMTLTLERNWVPFHVLLPQKGHFLPSRSLYPAGTGR